MVDTSDATACGGDYNGAMSETKTSELVPGQSTHRDNGERMGRSDAGHLVLMRRRISEPGFVVTVDAPARPDLPTVVITAEWAHANTAFDRMMREG